MLMDESQRLECIAERHFETGIVSQKVIEAFREFNGECGPVILVFQYI